MKENPLLEQSLNFASEIIKLQKFLLKEKKETIISKQIIKSATSIGSNINEANYANSKPDFISEIKFRIISKKFTYNIYKRKKCNFYKFYVYKRKT